MGTTVMIQWTALYWIRSKTNRHFRFRRQQAGTLNVIINTFGNKRDYLNCSFTRILSAMLNPPTPTYSRTIYDTTGCGERSVDILWFAPTLVYEFKHVRTRWRTTRTDFDCRQQKVRRSYNRRSFGGNRRVYFFRHSSSLSRIYIYIYIVLT